MPLTESLNVSDANALLQIVSFAGTITPGVGFTVIVKSAAVPLQPFTVGVTVMVSIIAVSAVLIAVKEPMLSVPLAARPIPAAELVQL